VEFVVLTRTVLVKMIFVVVKFNVATNLFVKEVNFVYEEIMN